MSISLSEVGLTENLGDNDEEVVNTEKRLGGGNQMRQMHAGRKEDRLAAEQKEWRAVIFTNRLCMSIHKGEFCAHFKWVLKYQDKTGEARFFCCCYLLFY